MSRRWVDRRPDVHAATRARLEEILSEDDTPSPLDTAHALTATAVVGYWGTVLLIGLRSDWWTAIAAAVAILAVVVLTGYAVLNYGDARRGQ